MKVNLISGGSDAFNAMLYTPPSQDKIQHYMNNVNNVVNTLGGLGTDFVNNVRSIYDKFTNNEVISAAKSIIHKTGMHNDEYTILPYTYDNIHTANLGMQQYIIAYPKVNKLYKDDMCYGFQDSYFNTEPNVYGTDRLDYRRVVDDMLQFESDEDSLGYVMHYSSSDDADELGIVDKVAVIKTWEAVATLISENIDPTDPDRGML